MSGLKAALEALGLPGGTPRKPRLPVPTEWSNAILAIVDELDLPAREGFS